MYDESYGAIEISADAEANLNDSNSNMQSMKTHRMKCTPLARYFAIPFYYALLFLFLKKREQ